MPLLDGLDGVARPRRLALPAGQQGIGTGGFPEVKGRLGVSSFLAVAIPTPSP